jgi:mono/diheme cytochrome c family protein
MILMLSLACASPESDPAVAAVLDLTGVSEEGAGVYADSCAHCHSEDGSGTDSGPGLRGLHASRDGAAVERILYGSGYEMPGFGARLSDQQVADVLAWVFEL